MLIGDNFSVGGGVEDVYPDGIYNPAAAVRFLEYQTGGSASEPAILGALPNNDPVSGRQTLMQNAIEPNRQQALTPKKVATGAIGAGGLLLVVFLGIRRSRQRKVNIVV